MPYDAFSYVDDSGQRSYFRKCPRYMVDTSAQQWLGIYQHYKNGHLYLPGGIAAQPAKFLEVMAFIEAEVNKSLEPEDGDPKS